MKVIRTTEGYMVEQDNGDYLCDEHEDNTWETRLEAESVMDIAQGGKGFVPYETKMINARQEAIEKLKTLAKDLDVEIAHKEADVVLCQLLFTLGYGDVVDEYHRIYKWYA